MLDSWNSNDFERGVWYLVFHNPGVAIQLLDGDRSAGRALGRHHQPTAVVQD